jgi:hypothetical protein
MADVFYESWGLKDGDDRCSRNVDIGGLLREVNGDFASALVFLDTATGLNTDTTLLFENGGVPAYDATKKKLSFVETAGAHGKKYLVTVRVTLTDGRHYDQSFWQEVVIK